MAITLGALELLDPFHRITHHVAEAVGLGGLGRWRERSLDKLGMTASERREAVEEPAELVIVTVYTYFSERSAR
jgi:hypothetical protein